MPNIQEAGRRIQENQQNSHPSLDLTNLALFEIPDATFQLTHLRKLSLTNNVLAELDQRLLKLHRLEILGLNYNRLSILPPWIGEMKSLRSLDCWNNQIRAIPLELGKMERLEYLTLGFNKLQTIPRELFVFLSRLKTLDLQSNPFEEMPSIRSMEIFDLMAYLRNETAYYGFIEAPKELATACQQFFTFFPEYVRRLTGSELALDVSRTKNGIKLTTYETPDFDIDAINLHFERYMQSLSPASGGSEPLTPATGVEGELLNLQLKLQRQHFTSQLEVLQFENRYLKQLVDNLVHVQGIMARNPAPLHLAVQTRLDKDAEDLLRQLRELVSGNEDAQSLYDELAGEVRSDDPDRGRIKTLWDQLIEKAPAVAAVMEIVSSGYALHSRLPHILWLAGPPAA